MGKIDYRILKRNPAKKRMFELMANFMFAPVIDPVLSEKIRQVAKDALAKNPKKAEIRAYQYPHFPSKSLLLDYLFSINEKNIYGTEIDDVLDFIEQKWLIHKDFTRAPDQPGLKDQEYSLNNGYIEYLHQNQLLFTYLFGFEKIVQTFQNSVYKIQVEKEGITSLGTGWIIDFIHQPDVRQRILVTNAHVVDNVKNIKVFNVQDELMPHTQVESFSDQGIDVAFIELQTDPSIIDFTMSGELEVLGEVITLGYPSIPMTKAAFQVAHRGEINSLVHDYDNQELFIISARTAPGNSGSPVINNEGFVVGMVTQELFERHSFEEKGITPYSACIPSKIINALFETSKIISGFKEQQTPST